ncbi:hypothetical protein HPP92_009643 [Vanilla planifolia]|uniref:Purple acid phosphatase n=1 Tax=Vanilla planifolia TaxID=51239 RepID=A0A835RJQ3_VANPL|nr:hypothetical protein HPP92_009643 [Vanilla planifolia]
MATYPSSRLLVAIGVTFAVVSIATGTYYRPNPRKNLFVPQDEDADDTTPQQVHITMVGADRVRVTWITDDEVAATVDYGTESGVFSHSVLGSTSSYSFTVFYKSGNIHEAVIGPLNANSVYYYRCSSHTAREFTFKTPPNNLPITFIIVGDLGQTEWTTSTLTHISQSSYDMLLLPGDLSYADLDQPLWDSFARLVEPLASSRPWMVTEGNHEEETIPIVEPTPFKAYNARWHMPFEDSASPSNLFYSFTAAGGAAHVLMLGSYTDFSSDSEQYRWLQANLAKVDRSKTPWLLALIHAPWYNSNKAHQGEGEDMRQALEEMLYAARVDAIFAGHVHAYERFTTVYNNREDHCGPVHITIGDGGNREGLARDYLDPQPSISVFREASFGHGKLEIVNTTYALWSWNRNDDDEAVVADSFWISSIAAKRDCQSKT